MLEARGIVKHFGAVHALDGASLSLNAGEVTALVGDNGAGKSTLVKVISGVLQPDAGELRVRSRVVQLGDTRVARREGIHTVFQDLALVGSLSIVENLYLCTEVHATLFGRRMPWLDKDAMRQGARQALDDLRITTVADIDGPVESLSGGQRQSVAIARAVREQAHVVILDEPTAALGVAQAAQVLSLIDNLRDAHTAVLVVSHNLREVFAVTDRIVVMRLGEITDVFETAKTDEEAVVAAIVGARPGARAGART